MENYDWVVDVNPVGVIAHPKVCLVQSKGEDHKSYEIQGRKVSGDHKNLGGNDKIGGKTHSRASYPHVGSVAILFVDDVWLVESQYRNYCGKNRLKSSHKRPHDKVLEAKNSFHLPNVI